VTSDVSAGTSAETSAEKNAVVKDFFYEKRVAFHETDTMGVLHHSNHVRYFEEARVAWLRARGLIDMHAPAGPLTFAVVELRSRYMKTARFDDLVEVWTQGQLDGVRIQFRYAIWNTRSGEWIAEGETVLVPLNAEMRPARLPPPVLEAFRRERWSQSWPPPRV
jgi:acyl-CoA thioester hydrolase